MKQKRPRDRKRGNIHTQNRATCLWGEHPGSDIFVVGTGTSLTGFDWTVLNNKITIALNDALLAPGFIPKYHIFCDTGIWTRYRDLDLDPITKIMCLGKSRDQFLRFRNCTFKDQVYHYNHVSKAVSKNGKKYRVICDPHNDDLYIARTVATGGIMAAYKLGARRIFMLGIDAYKCPATKEVKGGVYYYNGSGKGFEKRKEINPVIDFKGKKEKHNELVSQDRNQWWMKNMQELRQWFDFYSAFQESFVFRGPEGKIVFGSGVFNLSGLSAIDAWPKVKVKTVLGRNCFKGKE